MTDERWKRVADIYDSAQDKAADERSAFVRHAAAGDSGLRRDVESLLAEDDRSVVLDHSLAAAAHAVFADNSGVSVPGHLGTVIGPYRIDALLGVGGMGEVYRARDTKLNRDVAIKILPPAFASDPERLARFKREAQVLAALNHPNIAAIHGFEDSVAIHALVMELVDGPTLADRITKGALPIDEALAIARQIADALEAAHEQGIIHRDLKPANIKVRDDGTVKVLDFGLAKFAEVPGDSRAPEPRASMLSQSPTITTPAMTAAGMILGTAAYMSPEQAKGKPADKRSDIWAFGCVLYEMLTGTRAFEGADTAETLAAIIRAHPNFDRLPRGLAPIVRRVLESCFEKNRGTRPGDMAAMKFAMQNTSIAAVPSATSRVSFALMALVAGALAVVAIGTAWIVRSDEPRSPRSVMRSSILLGPDERFSGGNAHLISLSRDGRRLAYVANDRLYLRNLDELTSTAIPGTEGFGNDSTREPFFSPDGQWLGFWKGNQFKKVSISGGSVVTLTDDSDSRANTGGAHWEDDDTILFARRGGIWRVAAAGGKSVQVIATPDGQARSPRLLPGGHEVMYTFVPDSDPTRADVIVQAIDSNHPQVVVPGGADAEYLPNLLVYFSDGTVFAAPFERRELKLTGPPTALFKQVARGPFNPNALGQFTVSGNGTIVYVPESRAMGTPRQQFVLVDRDGQETLLAAPSRRYLYPRLSPDGSRIAVHIQEDALDLWSFDLNQGYLKKLTTAPTRDLYPAWADRQHVVYGSGYPPNVWRVDVDGGGAPERISHSDVDAQLPGSILPDGSGVLVTIGAPNDIALVSLKDGTAKTLLHSKTAYRNPEISPNGHWLAYQTNETGSFQIEVRPYPDVTAGRYSVSTDGGTQPAWSRSGDELFYVAPAGGLMGVSVANGQTWRATIPRQVVSGNYSWSIPDINGRLWDVAADGRHFLLMKPEAASVTDRVSMVIVQNALDDLRVGKR